MGRKHLRVPGNLIMITNYRLERHPGQPFRCRSEKPLPALLLVRVLRQVPVMHDKPGVRKRFKRFVQCLCPQLKIRLLLSLGIRYVDECKRQGLRWFRHELRRFTPATLLPIAHAVDVCRSRAKAAGKCLVHGIPSATAAFTGQLELGRFRLDGEYLRIVPGGDGPRPLR
ncbi:hypothetical protein D3C81_1441610 [compost metagenome]